tara:strand:+ start:1230 stop:2516 length:1287 start_codon:yes stop_codon:yes gene_type:complete
MRFKKPIVNTGIYSVPSPEGSKRVSITKDRLNHWTTQFNDMRESGISVPAPWSHSKEALPIQMGSDGTLPRSDINAGWWDKLWVDGDTLWGELDIPRNEDAVKIGTSVRESSIYVRPDFNDGSGNNWKDSLMHIALVTHPIENGQDNFQPVEANGEGISLAMSQLTEPLSMAEEKVEGQQYNAANASMNTVLDALRENKIDLPDDTGEDNFMERLLTALRQKKVSESPDEEEVLTNQPEGAKEQPAPVAMAQEKQETNVDAQQDSQDQGAVDLVMSHPKYKAAQQTIQFLLNHLGGQQKQALSSRRNALIESGKITEDYATKHLDPAIDGFSMSFGDDGHANACSAETIMEALESAPSLTGSLLTGSDKSGLTQSQQLALAMSQAGTMELPAGLTEETLPLKSESLDAEKADEVALEFLRNTGAIDRS